MDELLSGERIDEEERISLFARMRLVRAFSSVEGRRLCVIARLLALSILGMLIVFSVCFLLRF